MTTSSQDTPWHTKMMTEEAYEGLDEGIRFAVRVLHAAGIETCQSCEGGEGHAYPRPSIDIVASANDATGFAALAALVEYGIEVSEVCRIWNIDHSTPYECLWRIVLRHAIPYRCDEKPNFVRGMQAQ